MSSVCSNASSKTWTPLPDRFIHEHHVPTLLSGVTSAGQRHESGCFQFCTFCRHACVLHFEIWSGRIIFPGFASADNWNLALLLVQLILMLCKCSPQVNVRFSARCVVERSPTGPTYEHTRRRTRPPSATSAPPVDVPSHDSRFSLATSDTPLPAAAAVAMTTTTPTTRDRHRTTDENKSRQF